MSDVHKEFITQLVQNVKAMLGDDKMVAGIGNEGTGVYAIMISINAYPPDLVLSAIISMLSDQLLDQMAKKHNETYPSESKYIN